MWQFIVGYIVGYNTGSSKIFDFIKFEDVKKVIKKNWNEVIEKK